MDKIVVIGSVNSTKALLLKLIEHGFDISCVFGYEPKETANVSGYASFRAICEDHKIPYKGFVNINDPENIRVLSEIKPDIIFAVGFSQILKDELLNIPSKGVVGFHPTLLPLGRGRAPIAWLILKEEYGAANFFLMGKGADDGPIFVQEKFKIESKDNASDVEVKVIESIDNALNKWLPLLKAGEWNPKEQNHYEATEYARRAPLDGIINWYENADDIYRLVRASAKPHPGAFTFYNDYKMIIWNSRSDNENKITGVVGRIVKMDIEGALLVQTGGGLIWITEYEFFDYDGLAAHPEIMIGSRFGYYEQNEIYKLRNELRHLKNKIYELTGNA